MSGRFGLEIRRAGPGEAAGLAALLAECGRPVAPATLAGRLEAASVSGAVLVALEWGPPSGVVAVGWRATLLEPVPVARIELLLVGPERRRRGIGRLLLKAASRSARSAGCARIELADPGDADGLSAFAAANGFGGAGGLLARGLRRA